MESIASLKIKPKQVDVRSSVTQSTEPVTLNNMIRRGAREDRWGSLIQNYPLLSTTTYFRLKIANWIIFRIAIPPRRAGRCMSRDKSMRNFVHRSYKYTRVTAASSERLLFHYNLILIFSYLSFIRSKVMVFNEKLENSFLEKDNFIRIG